MNTTSPSRIDAPTLRERLAQPEAAGSVWDVRSRPEFDSVHIPGSLNVPLNLLEEHAETLAARLAQRQVVLVCQSGTRAARAQQRLAEVGVEASQVLNGGISGYIGAGSQVSRGRVRWSLERQVRLVAGTLVLGGLAAGLRLPRARLLSAGIGAGLTVSALTDTCTMGRILSALPYNRGSRDPELAEVLAQLPTSTGGTPDEDPATAAP
jgi:rhodanese-related sulfurtransferase